MKSKKVLLFFLLLFTGVFTTLRAQEIAWTSSPVYPSFTPAIAGVLSEEVNLNLHFQIVNGTLTDGKLRLVLPTGLRINSIAPTSGSASISLNTSGITFPATGTVEIPVTDIAYNSEVQLQAKVQAYDCAQTGTKTVEVSVLSGGNAIPDASTAATFKAATVSVVIPNITATVAPGNANPPALTDFTQSHTYDITLSVTNGVSAGEMKLEITKTKFITLSNFLLGTKSLTPVFTDDDKVTLELTTEDIGATTPISAANPQHLYFTAKATKGGTLEIKGQSIYPLAGGCSAGVNPNLFVLSLSYPSYDGGTGALYRNSTPHDYLTAHPRTNASMPLAFDGIHPNYVYCSLTNTGNIPITSCWLNFYPNYLTPVYISQTDSIYYKIGDTGDLKAVDGKDCTYGFWTKTTSPYFIIKNEFIATPTARTVQFPIHDILPGNNTKIYFYIPMVRGNMFDNSVWKEDDPNGISNMASGDGFYPFSRNILTRINSLTWDANGNTVPETGTTYLETPLTAPLFRTNGVKNDVFLDAGGTGIATLPFDFNYSSNPDPTYAATFHFELPPWLELDGDNDTWADAISFKTLSITHPTNGGSSFNRSGNTYSFLVKKEVGDSNTSILSIRYRAKQRGDGSGDTYNYGPVSTVSATIRYWVDWHSGYGVEKPNFRPILPYIAKATQSVTCLVTEEGIDLQTIDIKRLTTGLKVSASNERTPDNGVDPAPSNVINHRMYLVGDEGELSITGKISDDGNTYKNMYLLISLPGSYIIFENASMHSVTVDGLIFYAETVSSSGANTAIKFKYPNTGTFPSGETATVKLRFKGNANSGGVPLNLKVEAYMTTEANDAVNPLSPGNARHGIDYLTEQIATLPAAGPNYSPGSSASLSNNNPVEILAGYWSKGVQQSVYNFPKEYRPYHSPQRLRITLPEHLTPAKLRVVPTGVGDISITGNNPLYVDTYYSLTNNVNGTVTYLYDLTALYNPKLNPSYAEALAMQNTGKWILPDDYFVYTYYLTVTPSVLVPSTFTINTSVVNLSRPNFDTESSIDIDGGGIVTTYTGVKSALTFPTSQQTIYSKEVTLQNLTVSLTGGAGTETYPFWLYVEGNDIADGSLQLQPVGSEMLPVINGRWITLGDISANTSAVYNLKYTSSNPVPAGNDIKVYLVSGYGDNISAQISGNTAITAIDSKYRSVTRTLKTIPSASTLLNGSISVS
ncbi:MAG: hypothetical protein LBM08_11430, partial [Dysgonamonadaceae bacterium]|nr:hypothetical protein [Dysgonamonadaceae bacterium]